MMQTALGKGILTALVVGCYLVLPAAAQLVAPADECHEEGKDPLCGHLKATMARFLAEEQAVPVEEVTDTDVTHCFLDVEIDPAAHTISGTNTVTATSLVDGLTAFTLDLRYNMIVDGVTMGGSPVSYSQPGDDVVITLDRAYDTDESFEVVVAYHGTPQEVGFGSFDWSTHGGTTIVSTLSEPWYAYSWWPCKDVLGDKFTLDFWITVPDWMVVATNGRLDRSTDARGGQVGVRGHDGTALAPHFSAGGNRSGGHHTCHWFGHGNAGGSCRTYEWGR